MKILGVLAMAAFMSACATTKCKTIEADGKVRLCTDPQPVATTENKTETPKAAVAPEIKPPDVTPLAAPTPETTTPVDPNAPITTIRVYKYDNSRQCGQGTGVALEDMAKQLKNIKILSQEKKNDGMMRIQMCGAPTGVANVYEIEQKDLKKAAKLGFREWKYSQQ